MDIHPTPSTQPQPRRYRLDGRDYDATMSTSEVAQLLGCSENLLQKGARGEVDLPRGLMPLRLGNRLRWPTAHVAEQLGRSVEILDAEVGPSHGPADAGNATVRALRLADGPASAS